MRKLIYAIVVLTFATGVAIGQDPDTEGNAVGPDSGVVDRPTYDIGVAPAVDPEATVEESTPAIAPKGKAEKMVVISATWCIPCKAYLAVCKELQAEGYTIDYIYVDTEAGREKLKAEYSNIKMGTSHAVNYYRLYPTSFFIRDGVIVKKLPNVQSRKTVLKYLWKDEEAKNVIDKIKDRLPWNN